MSQETRIELVKIRTSVARNSKTSSKVDDNFAFAEPSSIRYGNKHCVIQNPTGNCQIFSLANFNVTVNDCMHWLRNYNITPEVVYSIDNPTYPYVDIYIDAVIDYLRLVKSIVLKPMLLLDLNRQNMERYKLILDKLRIISNNPYISTRGSSMNLILIDLRPLDEITRPNIFKIVENE